MRFRVTLIVFLLLVVSVVITLNLFFHKSYEAEMASQINRQQLLIVKTLAFSINDTLDHFKEEVIALSGLLAERGIHKDGLHNFLQNSFEELNEEITANVTVLGSDGRVVLSSISGYKTDAMDRSLYEMARPMSRGQFRMSMGEEHQLKMMSPLVKAGRFLGAVIISIDINDLNNKFVLPIKTGERGHAWIMDTEGTLIYHPTMPEMVGRNILRHTDDCFECHSSFNAEKNILEAKDVGFRSYIAPYGEDKLIAFSRVEMLNWIVCLSIPYSEVTKSINNSMRLQSLLVISILFSTVIVAFIIIIINRERVKAEAKAKYADKIREYADELEELIKERTQELRSEKDKLDALVGSVNVGISIFDSSGSCVWMNRMMQGWLDEQRRAKLTLDMLYKSERDARELWSAVIGNLHVQEVLQMDLGNKRGHFQISLTPFHLPDGSDQIILLLQDVTDLKIAEEQMIQSDKLAALSRLSAGVAHEIGNPLTSISSYVQILKGMDFDEFTNNALDTIYKHINRIETILRKMSSYTKTNLDEMGGHDISDLITSTVDLVRYDRRTKNIEIQLDIPDDIPEVRVNGNQMIQVIMNLVLNAADALGDGGALLISARKSEGMVEVSFKDSGAGIEQEHIGRIFDPFFTTKPSGTGLGLAVCLSIIKSFGGEIRVESKVGEGSIFTVRLPYYEK